MGMPLTDDIRRLAANGENPHLADLVRPAPAKPREAAPRAAPAPPPALSVSWWIPGLVLKSEANAGGTLPARLARKAAVKARVGGALALVPVFGWRLPVRVSLHRVGRRLLDDDNLAGAFTVTRDVVADGLGVDDGDGSKATWRCTQAKEVGGGVGVRITVEEVS